ncbi:hypothetical protein [Vibrio splendidus]|uniref:ATPase n=1 Tax=Vibrio splendidus TaxID=29497 RepID=A0A837NY30_VIBSP|nr:hypothetical protein [Vibrio splendidus]KPL95409.1 ATPase [Vibrio splendidus]
MFCKSSYLTASSTFIFGIFFSLIVKSTVDVENAPYYSVESTQNEIRFASHNFYSGTLAKESPYKSLDGKTVSSNNFVVDYPAEGVTLGQGWELGRSTKSFGTCIVFESKNVGGQMAAVNASKIFSSEQLKREIETSISASAKASYGGFGASASYKSNLVKKSKVESSFDTRLVKAEVVDGVEFVAPLMDPKSGSNSVALSDFALDLLIDNDTQEVTQKSIKAFWEYCGDAYVSAIERGAEMYVVSNNFDHSGFEETKSSKTIVGSISYLGSGGDIEKKSSSLMSALNNKESSKFEYYHSAHRGLYIPSKVDDIERAIQLLGDSSDQNKSFPFRVQLTSYSSLPNFPANIKLNTPVAERLYVYRDRLESIAAMLEHILGFTLINKNNDNNTKSCTPSSATDCVRESNLITYYEMSTADDSERQKHEDSERKIYEDLLKAVKRDILATNKEIEFCENTVQGVNEYKCVAEFDGKYNDYFYLALLPLPKIAQLYVEPEDAVLLDNLKAKLSELEKAYPNIVSRTYRVLKTCKIFGKKYKDKNLCGYTDKTQHCRENGSTAPCKKNKRQRDDVKRKINILEVNITRKNIPPARFDYYIANRMKQRLQSGSIDVVLNQQEIQYIRANIDCEFIGWDQEQCKGIDSIYDRIVNEGERLRFAYIFNPEAQQNRLKGYAESANAIIQVNNQAIDQIIKAAVSEQSREVLADAKEIAEPLQKQKQNFNQEELDKFLSGSEFLSPEQKVEYQRLKQENSELKNLSEPLLSDNQPMGWLGDRSDNWIGIVTPYSLYSSLNTLNADINSFVDTAYESSEHTVEPLFPLYSFDADFNLYVQSY